MAHTPRESVQDIGVISDSIPIQFDEPPIIKLRGRKRLLQSLQRISSSPSMARLARASSSEYRGTGKWSVSCMTLNSGSPAYSSSSGIVYGSQLPNGHNGYSTAPVSASGTPGLDTSFIDPNSRVRWVDPVDLGSGTSSSIPLIDSGFFYQGPARNDTSVEQDYFSRPFGRTKDRRENFNFWDDMPSELRMHILRFLQPKDIIRCSAVSKSWHRMCFDGQLWADLDTANYYQDIPADVLVKIISKAGPFVRDLNLRGCVQLWEAWRGASIADSCRNLENLSLEDCRIDRNSMHSFLIQNMHLVHVNLCGLTGVTNATMKLISQYCPKIEVLNISWCNNLDTKGLRNVVEHCHNLKDLRAGEIRGFDDVDFMVDLFKHNTLERLLLVNCDSLTDDSFMALIEGIDGEIDYLTGRCTVPPRKLKHLDISRCRNISDTGMAALVRNVPHLEGLRLSQCRTLTDDALTALIPTIPNLSHLDLEEVELLTNAVLLEIAQSPCKSTLQHLSISSCENLGDVGMLPLIKACTNLRNLDLDNTRISDLVLIEAAAMVRQRSAKRIPLTRCMTWDGCSAVADVHEVTYPGIKKPKIGLNMAVFDCQNVTWTGVREILSRNAEIRRPGVPMTRLPSCISTSSSTSDLSNVRATNDTIASHYDLPLPPSHPIQIIALKAFYGYQPTVTEHTRRVLRGDLASASRLERKWVEWMIASEEAGAAMGVGTGNGTGNVNAGVAGLGLAGNRRRRRRVREAQMLHADEEEGGAEVGVGRRRRARSGPGCAVM